MTSSRARRVACFAVSLLALIATDVPARAEPSLAARAARFAAVHAATADFTQEREVSLVDEVLRARGTLALAAPHHMRLELMTPERLTILANGSTVSVLDATGTPLPAPSDFAGVAHLARVLIGLLLGGAHAEGFEEHWRGPEAVSLTPRDPASPFPSIVLRFGPDSPLPREIVLTERGGDRTTIRLSQVRLNPPSPDRP